MKTIVEVGVMLPSHPPWMLRRLVDCVERVMATSAPLRKTGCCGAVVVKAGLGLPEARPERPDDAFHRGVVVAVVVDERTKSPFGCAQCRSESRGNMV